MNLLGCKVIQRHAKAPSTKPRLQDAIRSTQRSIRCDSVGHRAPALNARPDWLLLPIEGCRGPPVADVADRALDPPGSSLGLMSMSLSRASGWNSLDRGQCLVDNPGSRSVQAGALVCVSQIAFQELNI